ncbi:MerR family transcriptional regulator [Naumannella huperziae]
MQIGELSARTGVSPRALRHYEEQGLLNPHRTSGGYRDYAEQDAGTVERIRVMLAAGLGTATIRRYLDCLAAGEDGLQVQLCPDLRRELAKVEQRLDREDERVRRTRAALSELSDEAIGATVSG